MRDSSAAQETASRRTISAFGEQWTKYVKNDGYYGSKELLADICGPLLATQELAGARVADIGSGTGRIVRMLVDAGASHVVGIEPSRAFETLKRNTASLGAQVSVMNATGDQIPSDGNLDYVFSIGVLHHIPNPVPVVQAACRALRPGGKLLVWVYAYEGNERYLKLVQPLRALTTRLPHNIVAGLAFGVTCLLSSAHAIARFVGMPEPEYIRATFSKLTFANRQLVIYDQLRPAFARYYRESEIRALLEDCGFDRVTTYYRHGYSWTAVGCVSNRSDQEEFKNE